MATIIPRGSPKAPIAKARAHPDHILESYLSGHSLEQIAAAIGMSRRQLNRIMLEEIPDQWRCAQAADALGDLEDAQAALKASVKAADVLRASALVKSAQWRLERTMRRIYGADAPQVMIQINAADVTERIRVLEEQLALKRA